MSDKLIKYSCWCPEHDETVYSQFIPEDEGPITVCPLNENHTNISGVAVVHVDDMSIVMAKIVENNLLDYDTALTASQGHHPVIEAGQAYTDFIISYPYEVDVSAARYFISEDDANVSEDDRFSIIGIPGGDPFVGYLTQDADADDKTVHVSETVFGYLRHGLSFKFGSHDTIYHINAVDAVAGTFTLKEGLTQDISAGDLLYIRRYMCEDIAPVKGEIATIGDLSEGSAGLCANAQMVVRYTPVTPPASDFTLHFVLIFSY